MMMMFLSDKMVKEERNREQKYVVDATYLLVEIMEDDVGGFWWSWLVCGGLDATKEERRVDSIWRRRMVYGGCESMRGERSGEWSCGWRMTCVPVKCSKKRKKK